jgi:hypothetical protein
VTAVVRRVVAYAVNGVIEPGCDPNSEVLLANTEFACDQCERTGVPLWIPDDLDCGCNLYGVCDECSQADIDAGDIVVLEPATIADYNA